MAGNAQDATFEILKRIQESIAELRDHTDVQIQAIRRDMARHSESFAAEAREDHRNMAERFSTMLGKVPLREIRTEADYEDAVSALNALLDAGGADEEHPLAPLAAALGRFIGDYDDRVVVPALDSAH